MANLLTSLLRREPEAEVSRYTLSEYIRQRVAAASSMFFPGFSNATSYRGRPVEQVENSYTGYVNGAYKANTVVAACMRVRRDVFRQARFCWREVGDSGPGKLFRDDSLGLLERPWPNGSTGELLTRMITDIDLCGNSYIRNEGTRLRWLRPDWVSIVLSADPDLEPDVDVMGYVYTPGGGAIEDGAVYTTAEICHWAPNQDPTAQYRGMSWLTPAIREIQADQAATEHKLMFFTNGATLGPIIKAPPGVTVEQFKEYVAASEALHSGVNNAYRPFYIGGGVDVTLAQADMRQLDFKATQGAGETRVAALAGTHPVLVGLSEGLAGSSLNSGNFAAARRSTADITMWPLWQDVCDQLASFVEGPANAQLWIQERQIPFLREDEKDRAEIIKSQILALESGIRAGYKADPLVQAVDTGDVTELMGAHSNLYSVQLQPAGSDPNNPAAAPKLDLTRPGELPAAPEGPITTRAYVGYDLPDDDEIDRAGYRPTQDRFGKGAYLGKIPVAGRWRRMGGTGGLRKIFEALDTYARGEGPEDPLAGFRVPQLRRAAHSMGLAHDGGREELTGRIKDDVRKRVLAHRQAIRDLPRYSYGKGIDRPQVKDRDGKLRDIEIHQGPDGLSVVMLDDNNRPIGVAAAKLRDWRAVHQWARKRKSASLAGWVQKYHPVTTMAQRRRKARIGEVLSRLRGYDTWAEAELLLYGLEPAELMDLYRALGGDLDVLPRGPNGRIPTAALVAAIMAGWPKFRSVDPLDEGGDPMATYAKGTGAEIGDGATGGVYGDAGEWGEAGYGVGYGGDTPLDTDEQSRALGHDVTPGHDQLHHYWTRGKGLAKWATHTHPWTALYHHLLKYVGPERAKRMAAQWHKEVFGIWPGEKRGRNPVGPG